MARTAAAHPGNDGTATSSALLIIVVAGIVLSLCMGMRQSLGLFLAPMRAELGVSATAFGFALALQNLVWGAAQPLVGIAGDRYGARPVLVICAALYACGLALMAVGGRFLGLEIGAGLLCGIGVAGCGFGVVLGAVSRAVPPERRMQAVGIVSAAGSVATLFIAPMAQALIDGYDWQVALLVFAALAVVMGLVSLFIGGRPSAVVKQPAQVRETTGRAIGTALRHPGFLAMTIAFFACGFQLQFITVHLPTYLGICGVSTEVGAAALGAIGIANAIGSYVMGQLGARYSPKRLLALIYLMRTIAIMAFVTMPIGTVSTLTFAAVMGFLWLGVVPLVSGLIGRMFGMAHFNTLFGVAFFSHQVGGFAGAWLGGVVYDLTVSYAVAWAAMIVIGLGAFFLQWSMSEGGPREDNAGSAPSARPA